MENLSNPPKVCFLNERESGLSDPELVALINKTVWDDSPYN